MLPVFILAVCKPGLTLEVIQQVLEWLSLMDTWLSHECLQPGLIQPQSCCGKLNSVNNAEESITASITRSVTMQKLPGLY